MHSKTKSIEKSLKNMKATLAFEGLQPSSVALDLNRLVLEGKVSGEEARQAIFNLYKVKAKAH